MKFPSNPSLFSHGPDGLPEGGSKLKRGAYRCAIWAVFARHGMGVSAVGNDGTTHTAATDLPSDCGGTCTFSISPTSASFAAGGGTGTITVSTGTGCTWSAVSNSSFITITSGALGNGSGSAG